MLARVRAGELGGIYKEDERVPALRARTLGRGWWQVIPAGEDAVLLLDPANPVAGPPIIVFRDAVRAVPPRLDPALRKAFAAYRAFRSQPPGACRIVDGTIAETELPGLTALALVVPAIVCAQVVPPAPPVPDSAVANRFVAAHPTRFCFPGQPGTKNCAKLAAPRPILRVVIHTLAVAPSARTSAAEIVVRNWTQPGAPKQDQSAHYIVDRDGTITQMVRERDVAFHAGSRVNPTSIGVEHADVCNDPAPYTDRLYHRSAELVRDLCRRHVIAVTPFTILGHVDADPASGHKDPGPYWDWQYYLALLNWNPSIPGTDPMRFVLAAAEQPAPPAGWRRRPRRPVASTFCATLADSWGAVHWFAGATASQAAPAEFRRLVFNPGIYAVTLWWPSVPGGSRSVPVEVSAACTVSGLPCAALPPTIVRVDQSTPSKGWRDTGIVVDVQQPMDVRVRIHRTGATKGNVVADAVRLIKVAPL